MSGSPHPESVDGLESLSRANSIRKRAIRPEVYGPTADKSIRNERTSRAVYPTPSSVRPSIHCFYVSPVDCMFNDAEIRKPIIECISVDVIDIPYGVYPMHELPHNTVDVVVPSIDTDPKIAAAVLSADGPHENVCVPSDSPSAIPGCRRVLVLANGAKKRPRSFIVKEPLAQKFNIRQGKHSHSNAPCSSRSGPAMGGQDPRWPAVSVAESCFVRNSRRSADLLTAYSWAQRTYGGN